MAKVQAPITPTRLYRYRSLDRSPNAFAEEISSINNGYLWCADFTAMNDPMEGLFRSSALLREADNYRETLRQLGDRKSNVGIACFCEANDHMLMWAHYAGNFKGICFGYSTQALLKALPKDAILVRVAYVDKPPRLSITNLGDMKEAARHVLSQKQYNWSYEREWRVLATPGEVYCDRESLREVYLGTRISDQQRELIEQAVRALNSRKMHTKSIKMYTMELDGYSPTWDEVDVEAKETLTHLTVQDGEV